MNTVPTAVYIQKLAKNLKILMFFFTIEHSPKG